MEHIDDKMMLVSCCWVAEITAFSSGNLGINFTFFPVFLLTYIFSDFSFFLPALPLPIFIFLPAFPHSHWWDEKLYEKCQNDLKSNSWCCFPRSSGLCWAALLKSSSVSVEAHKFGCFYGSHSVFELPCVFISLTKLPPHFLLFLFHVFSVVYRMWISVQVS